MPLSASIFRRGGPKKELFDAISEDVDDERELDEKLAELHELLHSDKAGRELSAALWRPALCAAELLKHRKQCARDMGFIWGRKTYLHVEEAVFLLDRGDLLLFIEETQLPSREDVQQQGQQAPASTSEAVAGAGAQGDSGTDTAAAAAVAAAGSAGGSAGGMQNQRPRQRLLSVQEAFDLMAGFAAQMLVGVSMERYLLYCSLSRSGYLVMRHPSRWLLAREEEPQQVWGSGAWAACYGRTPAVPGTAVRQPMQQQLVAERAAAVTATAVAAAPRGVSTGDATAGDAASPMDVGARSTAAAAAIAGPSAARGAPPQRWRQAVGGEPTGAASTSAATAAAGCRGWWRQADAGHPHLQGVPEEFFRQLPPAIVADRLSTALREAFPNLRPLETIHSVLAAGAAAASPSSYSPPAASLAGPAGDITHDGSAADAHGGSSGISLGTLGVHAHLVFDVYKPGSFVSRYKGQFPAVQTHIAVCSEAPPTLGEMRAADAAAAAAAVPQVAAAGEAGRPASVTWAAVLNGDIALYSIGRADLLRLL